MCVKSHPVGLIEDMHWREKRKKEGKKEEKKKKDRQTNGQTERKKEEKEKKERERKEKGKTGRGEGGGRRRRRGKGWERGGGGVEGDSFPFSFPIRSCEVRGHEGTARQFDPFVPVFRSLLAPPLWPSG